MARKRNAKGARGKKAARRRPAPKRAASEKRSRGGSTALARARRPVREAAALTGSVAHTLFPPEEIERLKLVALTSARREDKIEALRRIAFSPLDPESKADLFLGRLTDPDPDIRIEAAQLLRGLGLDPDVAEAVRELEHGDEPQKIFAIDRLGRRMARGGALEVGAGLIALVWRLREERTPTVRTQLLERLEEASGVIAAAPARAEELVRLLVTLFASDPVGVGSQARRLVRRLGDKLPDRLREVLWSECDATSTSHVRIFVLQLLGGLSGAERDERLPSAMAEEIAHAEEGDIAFRTLGDRLMHLGDAGVAAMLSVFPKARPSQQRYIIRVAADACRYMNVSTPVKEDVASLFLGLLGGHQREVQMTVLQTQLLADGELSDETRKRLADAFLSHIHLFAFPSDIENVEHTISNAGLSAIEPLVERLGPRSSPVDRQRAARVLGELARIEGEKNSKDKATREALLNVLRTLQRWSLEPDFPDKTAVFTAMGKVVSAPIVPADTVELVARNLLERRDAENLGCRVLEALGHLAASPHVSAARVDQIEVLFRGQLEAELPDIATVQSEEDGVVVFAIGQEAEVYTDAVPAATRGMARIALGRTARPERVADITAFLLSLWEQVATGELQWGPPGSGALVESLRDICCGLRIDVTRKVAIVKSLAKRMSQLPVIEALSAVFSSEDRSVDLGRLAAAAGVALLRRRTDGKFHEEEREHALKLLASIIGRETLDCSTDITKHLRKDAVEELFAGVRDGVPGCYEMLARLREKAGVPETFREELSRRLAAYESLVPA